MVAKVNTIDTSEIALKIKRDTDKSGLEKKDIDAEKEIPDTTRLVKKTDYSANIFETESEIYSISGLATITPLTSVKNKNTQC